MKDKAANWHYRWRILLFSFGVISFCEAQNQSIPSAYQLLYSQNFEERSAVYDFDFSDPTAWGYSDEHQGALELKGKSDYNPPFRSPFNIALIRNRSFGSFILEAELAQTGREYGHRDLCLFFNVVNPSNFYYVHLASVADDHANNIFLVNDAPRIKIASKTTDGTLWGATDSWHQVRIERDVETGTIKIFFDHSKEPIMEAKDDRFKSGFIGFGSFDDTGLFDSIKVWGPINSTNQKSFFNE